MSSCGHRRCRCRRIASSARRRSRILPAPLLEQLQAEADRLLLRTPALAVERESRDFRKRDVTKLDLPASVPTSSTRGHNARREAEEKPQQTPLVAQRRAVILKKPRPTRSTGTRRPCLGRHAAYTRHRRGWARAGPRPEGNGEEYAVLREHHHRRRVSDLVVVFTGSAKAGEVAPPCRHRPTPTEFPTSHGRYSTRGQVECPAQPRAHSSSPSSVRTKSHVAALLRACGHPDGVGERRRARSLSRFLSPRGAAWPTAWSKLTSLGTRATRPWSASTRPLSRTPACSCAARPDQVGSPRAHRGGC